MGNTQGTVGKEDLYALREFFRKHYQPNQKDFSLPGQSDPAKLKFDYFTVTYAYNNNESDLEFAIRRVKLFKFYDVVKFTYFDGAIFACLGEFKDRFDGKLIEDVRKTLSGRCYKEMVQNLDYLVLE